ncbi:MAG: serine protease [Oscillibacter sp.]
MKKRILAFLCVLTLFLGTMPAALALAGEETRAADTLSTLGLVTADLPLTAPATRAQAVVMTVRLSAGETAAQADRWISGFYDVPPWLQTEMNYAAHQGWVSGTAPNRFDPNQTVTADAFCTFLLRMLGYSDEKGDFLPSEAAAFARHMGLISIDYTGGLTRGDLCAISAGALTFCYKGSHERVIDRLISTGTVRRSTANALGLLTQELTARQVSDRLSAAVFCLSMYDSQLAIDAEEPSANASGFFITPDGLAVTNYHALPDSIRAVATLENGRKYEVEKIIYADEAIDIAVIQLSKTSLDHKTVSVFPYLETASSSTLRSGDTVYTLGNPLGLGLAISSGVVSSPSRVVERYQLPCIMNTADISQGSSGGALLNSYGQAVGVTAGAYIYGNNMYLAVPIDPALNADLTLPGQTLSELTKQTKNV